MVYSDQYAPRRRATDEFGSRRDSNPVTRRLRDDSYDHSRASSQTSIDRDRDRDREAERGRTASDNNRPPDRPVRGRNPAMPRITGRPSSSDYMRPELGRSDPARPGQPEKWTFPDTPRGRPTPPTSKPTQPSVNAQPAKRPESQLLGHMMQNYRELGELERNITVLDLQLQKRKTNSNMSLQRESEYPKIPQILRKAADPYQRQRSELAAKAQKTKEREGQLCDQLIAKIFPAPDRKSSFDRSAQGELESLSREPVPASKPKEVSDERWADVEALRKDNILLKEANGELKGEIATLKKDISSTKADMDRRNTLLDKMASRLEGIEAAYLNAKTQIAKEVGRLDTCTKQQGARMDMVEEKMNECDSRLAEITTASGQMAELVTLEKGVVRDLHEQNEAMAELRNRVKAFEAQNGAVTIAVPAVDVISPQAFPGDDFTSVRNEICSLGQRLESLRSCVKELTQAQHKAAKDESDNSEKLGISQLGIIDTFGSLIRNESAARNQILQRLIALERIVSELKPNLSTPKKAGFVGSPVQEPAPDTDTIQDSAQNKLRQMSDGQSGLEPAATNSSHRETPASETNMQALEPAADSRAAVELDMLQTKVAAIENALQAIKIDLDEKYNSLRLSVSTIDTQYNNLMSKDLYDAIIGRMQELYPNTRLLQQDLANIDERVHQMEQASSKTNSATAQKRRPVGEKDGSTRSSSTDPAACKRRKLDSKVTGNGCKDTATQ